MLKDRLHPIILKTAGILFGLALLLTVVSVHKVIAQGLEPPYDLIYSERFNVLSAFEGIPGGGTRGLPPGSPTGLVVVAEGEPTPFSLDTYCEDQFRFYLCDQETHQLWAYWCQYCCNDPEHCPTGCCDTYCWWVEAGTC